MRSRIATAMFGDALKSQTIAHYEVTGRIGVGGMGVVYEAIDRRLDRPVALKLLRRKAMSEDHELRLVREARSLAKLSHPNVVSVYEVDKHEGDVYVAMEFVRGQTLWAWQQERDRSWSSILAYYRQAGAGLAAAHAVGIIHRDFKPTNALVGDDGRVRVADFGLAIERGVAPGPTQSRLSESGAPGSGETIAVAGTPGYIAPELFRACAPDERSDQYSFCVALLEALIGQRASTVEVSAVRRVRPRWLRAAMRRGLEQSPDERWPSMNALLAALDTESRVRRRRAGSLIVVGLGLGLASATMLDGDAEQLCTDPSPRFDAIWTTARRRGIVRQLGVVGPWATPLAARIDTHLGDYRGRWVRAAERVCESTHVYKLRSSESFERASVCLERHLQRLDQLLSSLEIAEAEALGNIERQLAELGDPSVCTRQSQAQTPRDSHTPAVEAGVDRARLALAAGDDASAARVAQEAVDSAKLGQDAVVLAEALLVRSQIHRRGGEWVEAERAATKALLAANRGGDSVGALRAACGLVKLHALRDASPAEAQFWYELAVEAHARIEEPGVLEVELLGAHASLARSQSSFEVATRDLERAIEIGRVGGIDRFHLEELELELANNLAEAGQTERALERYRGLRGSREQRLGAGHPGVAIIDFDLGFTQLELGEAEAAIVSLERALAVQRAVFGRDSVRTLPTLIKLGEAHLALGRFDRLEELALEALELERRTLAPSEARRLNATSLRRAARAALADFEGLLELDEDLIEELGDAMAQPERAAILHEIAWTLCRLGRPEQAASRLAGARRLAEGLTLVYVDLTRAEIALRTGELKEASEGLDELRARIEASGDLAGRAEYAWLIARAEEGRDAEFARELAERALELYEPLGAPPDIQGDLLRLSGREESGNAE